MCTFFNLQNDNKLVKEGSKLILDRIATNQVIYVPMLSKIFDMEESKLYDSLTDEDVIQYSKRTQKLAMFDKFHTKKEQFNSNTHVRVRILHNEKLDVDFQKN